MNILIVSYGYMCLHAISHLPMIVPALFQGSTWSAQAPVPAIPGGSSGRGLEETSRP